jgi:hypothetical protein
VDLYREWQELELAKSAADKKRLKTLHEGMKELEKQVSAKEIIVMREILHQEINDTSKKEKELSDIEKEI